MTRSLPRTWHAEGIMNLATDGSDLVVLPSIDTKRVRIRVKFTTTGTNTEYASALIGAVQLGSYDGMYIDATNGAELKTMCRELNPGKDGGKQIDDSIVNTAGGYFQVDISMAMLPASMQRVFTLKIVTTKSSFTTATSVVDVAMFGKFGTVSRMGFHILKIPCSSKVNHREQIGIGRTVVATLVKTGGSQEVDKIILDMGGAGRFEYSGPSARSAWATYKEADSLEAYHNFIQGVLPPQATKVLAITLDGADTATIYCVEEVEKVFIQNQQVQKVTLMDRLLGK